MAPLLLRNASIQLVRNNIMRIAFVTPEYITEKNFDGGLANYLGRVCPALVKMGHDVAVVVTSNREGRLVQDGVEVHRVVINPVVLFWLNRLTLRRLSAANFWILQSWFLNRACAKLHRERNFDLIQYASYTATGLFRLRTVPAIVRLSSYEPMFQRACDHPASLNNRLKAYLEKVAIGRADAVFCPSQVVADAASRDTGKLIKVIESPFTGNPREVDDQPFKNLLEGRKFLLFFGMLSALKGVLSIAEIIGPLLSAHSDLHFVFIGKDGGYLNRPMIEHVWEKAGSFRGRVLYMGQMQHSQLYPILSHATAVVLPSRIDNLPNTCLEAMACRRIVIGTRGASFEQLIEDGVSGFLAPVDSPVELLGVVEKMLAWPDMERLKMGELAAQRIEALRPEIVITRLVAFYESVIAGRAT